MSTEDKSNGMTPVPGPMRRLLANATRGIAKFFQRTYPDRRRNINDECGYPSDPIEAQTYQDLYERNAIAARVVEVFPSECWQSQPSIYETEDQEERTEWEDAIKELDRSLRQESFLGQDEGLSNLCEIWKRADEQSRIGHYGVILIGLNDQKDLSEPAEFVKRDKNGNISSSPKNVKITYLRVFPESLAAITGRETDRNSPRFGMPTKYMLSFDDSNINASVVPATLIGQEEVHWTRIVHIALNVKSNEVYSDPEMHQVLNHILDLEKLYGGSAEMYYKGAFPGISFETDPALGGDVDVDVPATKDMYEEYANGLQRALFLTGVTAKMLSPTVVDPTPQIQVHLDAICIKKAIPKRIFMGSERGNLASSQDDKTWNERKGAIQSYVLTPRVIAPTIDRFIMLGVLPPPSVSQEGLFFYRINWPDLSAMSDAEKVDIGLKRTQALAQFVQSGASAAMTLEDFFARILQFSDDEARSIIENLQKQLVSGDAEGQSPLVKLVGSINGATELFTAAHQGIITEEQLKRLLMLFFTNGDEKAAQDIIADGIPEVTPAPSVPSPNNPFAIPPNGSGNGNNIPNSGVADGSQNQIF
jgi:hypothetical protein